MPVIVSCLNSQLCVKSSLVDLLCLSVGTVVNFEASCSFFFFFWKVLLKSVQLLGDSFGATVNNVKLMSMNNHNLGHPIRHFGHCLCPFHFRYCSWEQSFRDLNHDIISYFLMKKFIGFHSDPLPVKLTHSENVVETGGHQPKHFLL